jgi:glycerol-3-phosphate dehydrogenase (NAD(P)+)
MIQISEIKIGVVGAGSWGTVIANLLGSKGYKIDLWAYEKEVKDQIETYRENKMYLPGFSLSTNIFPSNDIAEVVSGKDIITIVVPSHVMRQTARNIFGHVTSNSIVVSATKGIENKTHLTMSGVLKETLPELPENVFAVLSGPSFAKEVAKQFPTVVSVASHDQQVAEVVQRVFATPYFRVYTNNDMIGVELGGAVKNVIAIACGISHGLGLGLNTKAALITRGLTEIRRLGIKLGADPRTLAGIAGVGDLILTCTGDLSRNHTVGKKIGEGMKLKDILSEMRTVAEGVKTAKSVYNLSRKLGIEMPISHEVYHILYDDVPPKDAWVRIMSRDLKQEFDDQ